MNFDRWRDDYDRMSFDDHQAFNAAVAEKFPVQQSYNADAVHRFLAAHEPAAVIEVGGWDGALAAEMLAAFPSIGRWSNYDITPNVPQSDDPRYRRVVLQDWPWNHTWQAPDAALVVSHVLEHMRASEVDLLMAAMGVGSVYVDCPLGPGPSDWRGYQGMHILEVGHEQLTEIICGQGFELQHAEPGWIGWFACV